MNVPEVYLVEPYNAYAPKGRKKHWHEVIEEQALLARILAEQQALQETQNSRTLPPNSPDISSPAVGNMNAGAGGTPAWDFWAPGSDVVNFSFTPTSGDAPLTVAFTNLTTTPQFDTYNWYFTLAGVTTTSTDVNPTVVFQTGSFNPSQITASLQTTNSITGVPGTRSLYQYIPVSRPQITSSFTYTTSSNVAPFTASFVNTSVNTSQTPSTTYKWVFTYNDGVSSPVITTSSLATPPAQRVDSGSFTASLQTTGSYNIQSSSAAVMFLAPAPTLNISFTVTSASKYSPSSVTLTPTVAYNGIGTVAGTWYRGEYSEAGNEYSVAYAATAMTSTYDTRSAAAVTDGKFTASLALTESVYGIRTRYTQSFALTFPTVTAAFTTRSFGNGGVENNYLEPVSMSYTSSTVHAGNGTLTYLWDFGSASFYTSVIGATTGTSTTVGPHFRADYNVVGGYTASLQVTESRYGVASKYTQSFVVST